jgi:hypothetical protein
MRWQVQCSKSNQSRFLFWRISHQASETRQSILPNKGYNQTNGEREGTANAKGDVVDSKKAGEPKREQAETSATDQISAAAAAPASANEAPPAPKESVIVQEQAQRTEDVAQRKTQPAAKPAESVAVTSADEQRSKEPEKQTKGSENSATPSVGGYAGRSAGLAKLKNAPKAATDRATEEDKPINGREDKDNSKSDRSPVDVSEKKDRPGLTRRLIHRDVR